MQDYSEAASMGANAAASPEGRLARLEALPDGPDREFAILAALDDESPLVREQAIKLATRFIEPKTLGKLVADELNAGRRNAALTALERQGPYAVSHLESMLHQYHADVVMFALQTLARIGDPSIAPAVLPFVRHTDLNVAQAAIEALGKLRSREAVPLLVELLHGKLWLQLAAIEALGDIGDPSAVRPLLDLLPDPVLAGPAIGAVERIGAPESLPLLVSLLSRTAGPSSRNGLLLAIGRALEGRNQTPALPAGAPWNQNDITPEVVTYLETILQGSATREEDRLLVRAAVALALSADLRSLIPAVLAQLAGDPPGLTPEDLVHQAGPALFGLLPKLLTHPDVRVRRGALLVGEFTPEALPAIREHLVDRDELVRAAACRALGSIDSADVLPLLIERIEKGQATERAAAVEALARVPADALVLLEPCLLPERPDQVLIAALQVFGTRTGAPFEARILELCRHRSAVVRKAALSAAGRLSGSRVDVVLLRALADRDPANQLEALAILVRRGGDKTVTMLMALLASGDSLRCHVIRALGHLKAEKAVTTLEALYHQCGPQERTEIILALTRIAPASATKFLLGCMEEPSPDIRRVAAQGFAMVAERKDLPLLRMLAEDKDWQIRNAAALGFGLIGAPESEDVLLTLVRDLEPTVAQTARRALSQVRGESRALCA
jgi:HEAT repeat protein